MNQDPTQLSVEYDLSRRVFLAATAAAVLSAAACTAESGRPASDPGDKPTASMPSEATPSEAVPTPNDPQLNLLEQYRANVDVAPTMMDFIGFPETEQDAKEQAASLANRLRTWSVAGVRPIVIMEPTVNGQPTVDLEKMGHGAYDAAIDTFFSSLKEAGVTDKQMGTLVPLPESNTPTWDNGVTDPKLFITNVTRIAKACKRHFPEASLSVMLDSQTFLPSPDPDWANGTMNSGSLLQYLKFEPGLIDSFGLQGFTWDGKDSASEYLNARAAIAGAKQLGVKHIWFNTGTYSTVNNPNGLGVIQAGSSAHGVAARRSSVLQGVLLQAAKAQAAGLQVDFINIFAQDTLNTSPDGTGTANYRYTSPEDISVLREFVDAARKHKIPVTIFDAVS